MRRGVASRLLATSPAVTAALALGAVLLWLVGRDPAPARPQPPGSGAGAVVELGLELPGIAPFESCYGRAGVDAWRHRNPFVPHPQRERELAILEARGEQDDAPADAVADDPVDAGPVVAAPSGAALPRLQPDEPRPLGLIRGADLLWVHLRFADDARERILAPGQRCRGWLLEGVEGDRAHFRHRDGRVRRLRLPVEGRTRVRDGDRRGGRAAPRHGPVAPASYAGGWS